MSLSTSLLHPHGMKFASLSSESVNPGGQYLLSCLGKDVSINIKGLCGAAAAFAVCARRSGVALVGRLSVLRRAVDIPKVFSLARLALDGLWLNTRFSFSGCRPPWGFVTCLPGGGASSAVVAWGRSLSVFGGLPSSGKFDLPL